ncbi:MAG: PIN domain-containing protein [Candidatus Brocadia sp.]|nr:PIN domain-containing protein [Candidatus Brocadia sp.]
MHGRNPVHSEGKISMAKKGVESCFIDTNILVYASDVNSRWCRKANQALKNAISGGYPLFISPQVLREYLSVATRSVTHEKTIPWDKIVKNHFRFQRAFKVLPEDIATAQKLGELVQKYHVSGKQVHDANIVATMLVHGIQSILTRNVDDFKRYKGLIKILLLEE